jgi:hypothetical protein
MAYALYILILCAQDLLVGGDGHGGSLLQLLLHLLDSLISQHRTDLQLFHLKHICAKILSKK